MKTLVISEKYNAAQRISYILSGGNVKRVAINKTPTFSFHRGPDEYVVVGLRGHVLELDYPEQFNSWERTDLKDLVWAEPYKRKTALGIAHALVQLARESDKIIIATDFDREGELIGMEALEIVKSPAGRHAIKRARFSALTKYEIEAAFDGLAEMDYNLARAAESRQIIDLAWGAVITRFLSLSTGQVGRDFLSAGRVQSPTLALVVDREIEIEKFKPQPYWQIIAHMGKDAAKFQGTHEHGIFHEGEKADAERVFAKVRHAKKGTVESYESGERNERPPPPFNTTQFLMEANKIGYSAQAAMKIAEDLYTNGWISYPRTDNTVYPKSLSLKTILGKLKDSEFKKEAEEVLSQEAIRPSRGKFEATDHPPIHPVEGAKKSDLKRDQWGIYELVVRRFLATLAPDCIAGVSKAAVIISAEKFNADGYVIKEPGWRKYYNYWRTTETLLPTLTAGGQVDVESVEMPERFTRPPSRFTQGALISEMEKKGLGTKSTRHEIIQKLYDRKYVNGKSITPTLPGRAVTTALEDYAGQITKPEMTALLENEMTEIAEGRKEQAAVVKESQEMLAAILEDLRKNKEGIAKEITEALRQQNYLGKCGCGGELAVRRSRMGGRFMGCTNYPNCNKTYPLPQTGHVQATEESCPTCNLPKIHVIQKDRGAEKVCVNPECPHTHESRVVGKCNKCGKDLKIIHSQRGKRFVGCSGYPNCNRTYPLPQMGKVAMTGTHCEHCKAPIVNIFTKGRRPWVLCIDMECPGKKKRKKPSEFKASSKKAAPKKKTAAAAPETAPLSAPLAAETKPATPTPAVKKKAIVGGGAPVEEAAPPQKEGNAGKNITPTPAKKKPAKKK